MNKDNAAQYLPLVQALAEGKEVQEFKAGEGWLTFTEHTFTRLPKYYRIRPEPVKLYVATWFEGHGQLEPVIGRGTCMDKNKLESWYGDCPGFKLHELDCGEAP